MVSPHFISGSSEFQKFNHKVHCGHSEMAILNLIAPSVYFVSFVVKV
jgi:hypothetical protein